MRKILETIALLLHLYAWAITAYAIFGGNHLPAQIPTHFNAAAQPDEWGTPAMLWLIPVVATFIHLLMTLVARYPAAFHFPVRCTPATRRRLEAIDLGMLSWLKVEVVCFFGSIQCQTIQFARRGEGVLFPFSQPAVLVLVFGTVLWHLGAMRRVAANIR